MSPSFYAEPPEASREDLLRAYLQFLQARDGGTDPTRPYPERERWLAKANAAPVLHRRAVDAAAFQRSYLRFDPAAERDPAVLALLAFVKVNATEAYGVQAGARVLHRKPPQGLADSVLRTVAHEETYHTRILLGATHQFGLSPPRGAWIPPLSIKLVIASIVYSPEALRHPLVLASEIAGVFLFDWMMKKVDEVVKDEPALRDSMEERLTEILIDELGHVAFNRMLVGRTGVSLGRMLSASVASSLAGLCPELGVLGWTKSTASALGGFDFQSLPEQVRQRAFFA